MSVYDELGMRMIKSFGLGDHQGPLLLSTLQPDPLDHPREEESQNMSHFNPSCFTAAPGEGPVAGNGQLVLWLNICI